METVEFEQVISRGCGIDVHKKNGSRHHKRRGS